MPPSSQANANVLEKLGAVLAIGYAVMKTAHALVRFPLVKDPMTQPTLSRELYRVFIRNLLNWVNAAQSNWALPSSTGSYKLWISLRAKKEGIPAEVVTEVIGDDGAKLHWIGRKDAKKVLLHFHSGGFVLPLHSGHFNLINRFRREIMRRSGVDVKAAFLEYTLSSRAKYPTQYRQAMRIVHHVINSGVSPADIVISGDSAGGMLAMQLLSIYLHPNPSISSMPIPSVPFAGILVISPWVVMESNTTSFVNNGGDLISDITLRYYASMLPGTERTDTKDVPEAYWREPLRAPTEWWHGADKVTKHILFIYGRREALRDDILSLIEKVREGTTGTELNIATREDPAGVHIASVIDASIGLDPCDVTKFMAEWVHDRIVT